MGESRSGRPRVVALGGGHGLAVTLRALVALHADVTAIIGTGDDGGSSGRLRADLGVPPPGDLRMALVALSGDGSGQSLWSRVMQHRFGGSGDLEGHALGNLLLAALWEETGDVVAGIDALGRALEVQGRVLPNCVEAVDVVAQIASAGDGDVTVIEGQARVTATRGRVSSISLIPPDPRACPQAVEAIQAADAIVFGPGSWFTSVLPHLLVPGIAEAIDESSAPRILILNAAEQPGETSGFESDSYLESWRALFPTRRIDVVLADPAVAGDRGLLVERATAIGATVHLATVLSAEQGIHDPRLLAAALEAVLPHPSP